MDPFKYFPNRRENEKIILLLRRHWHAIARYFVVFLIEAILPIIVFVTFLNFGDYSWESTSPMAVIIILGASAYYLFIWLFFFHHWIDYYLDVWVVTDQRIVNIEQKGLFSRTISEVNIEKVQDVTSEAKGKWATLLKFGDVHIQTAAEEKRFIFSEIANPSDVARTITELHRAAERNQGSSNSNNQLKDDYILDDGNVSRTF